MAAYGEPASRRIARAGWPSIGTGILAGGGFGQPAEVMRPTLGMGIALRGAGQAAVGHAQQCAAILFDQIDLDQAGSRRHLLVGLPAKTVGEAMHRHDLAEGAAARGAANAF